MVLEQKVVVEEEVHMDPLHHIPKLVNQVEMVVVEAPVAAMQVVLVINQESHKDLVVRRYMVDTLVELVVVLVTEKVAEVLALKAMVRMLSMVLVDVLVMEDLELA
jgi:hypothetical protein